MNRAALHRLAALQCLLLALCRPCAADWLDDIGYRQLGAELGAALPTGAGISVLQTEAGAGIPQASATSPFAGAGNYFGKTFTMDSSGLVYADHANAVAGYFYGNISSASPGVTDVHLMDADDFVNAFGAASPPPVPPGIIHNGSWIGFSTGSAATDNLYLRAFDYQIDRDGLVSCTPLNNGTGTVPTFMANSYHSISVGLRSGNHSLGGSTADGTGRMKPDLVVNEAYTSLASPAVASVAALLRQAIKAGHTAADNPWTIKAILLAGASKNYLPGWHRAGTTAPYDSTFGAGELNVLHAHHILSNGRQAATLAAEVSSSGWDSNAASSPGVKRYFFSVPAGSYGNIFSAALTWHRTLVYAYDPGDPPAVPPSATYSSMLPDLNLKLYAAGGLVVGALLDQSLSVVDNAEHIFQRNLPAGQYALEVSGNTDGVPYGLAWEVQPGAGPSATPRIDAGVVFLELANLDPFTRYTVEKSANATADWTSVATVRTADTSPATTHTWQDPAAPLPAAAFYRLRWSAIR
jgi:hypothetical protein